MRLSGFKMFGFAALVVGALASPGAGIGCAAERDPISRVQLRALPKSFFVGANFQDTADDPEFYARSMVVDVPYGESSSDFLMFTNSINHLSRIKWQITEGRLLGRVSFERIQGTDGKGLSSTDSTRRDRDPSKPLSQNEGLVVYEFPIESQFDIRREYNPQTGEESNVIVENSTDRPWTQREYIRVDFSKNLVTTAYDFDTLSLLGMYNGVKYSPMEYDVRDPSDKDAPVLDVAGGYFDVTNKVFANPQMIDLGGIQYPGCMLPSIIRGGTSPSGNCNPNEITVRHSFKRVVDSDYEPVDWDGFRFETYGAFTVDRLGYARDYGLADKTWRRFIARYNIWERSHYYADPAAMTGAVACKADAECSEVGAVPGMSHCDTEKSKCTLPYRDRKPKPVVWHYSQGSNPAYFEVSREAADEWDAAMRSAVVAARYAECQRFTPGGDCGAPVTGNWAEEENVVYLVKEINACRRGEVAGYEGRCEALADELARKRSYSPAVKQISVMNPMVIMCHSPVDSKDPAECGPAGTVARLGDIRYHLVTSVEKAETNSPWGIMSDSNDPTTGEHISSSINVWTHVNDLFARGLVDTLRYIAGELKTEDVTDGKNVNDWVEAARTMGDGALSPRLSKTDFDKRIAAIAGTSVESIQSTRNLRAQNRLSPADEAVRKRLIANLNKVAHTRSSIDAPSSFAPTYEARRNLLKGTSVEAGLVTPAMQDLARSALGQLTPAQTVAATSVLGELSPQLRRSLQNRLETALADRGSCIMQYEATAPLGYVGFGDVLQEKFGKFNAAEPASVQLERATKMKEWLARRVHYSVMTHEMGHSVGLRHNFISSSDAWNFRPQYWQLRTNDKAVKTECADGSSDGSACVGPRWNDPVTAHESKHLIHMWTQSSTMDYAGEPSQDLLGLGRYDFGAARMFYGDTATVYDTSRFQSGSPGGDLAQAHQNEFGGLLGVRYGDFHYSQLDTQVGLIEDCQPVDTESFRPVNWRTEVDGEWHPVADGHIVPNQAGKYTRCKEPKVDFVQWDTLKDVADENRQSKTHAVDAKKRVRVPHGFASDDWADLGNVAVFRHDNGADLYETMHFWIAQQEVSHIFSNYRRGRRDFSVWGAFSRTLGRYHEKMRDAAKGIGLFVTLARETVSEYNAGNAKGDPKALVGDVLSSFTPENAAASAIAFDHFTHVFSRPQPGEHGRLAGDSSSTTLRSFDGTGFANTSEVILSIPNGVSGGYGAITLGGRPIENGLARDVGRDYSREYTLNVGSYYEKAFVPMLMTESADNFISASRDDFVDARFRAVSLADVFPDGFRRWLGNNLTNDEKIKGVYVLSDGATPRLDSKGFATIGTTSWWPSNGIEVCFPTKDRLGCRDPFSTDPTAPPPGLAVDPQVGWEQQKFAILFTLLHIPENSRTNWLDQMRIWEVGAENDPEIDADNQIRFYDPAGKVYIARTFGTETLFGKTVQKGIAARVLEYANEVLQRGVVTTPVARKSATWYVPTLSATGQVQAKAANGSAVGSCEESRDCTKVKNYVSVIRWMREAQAALGYTRGVSLKGVY